MKKLGLLAMAFALVMTMSQCKKENTTTSNDECVKVPITLNVSSNGGSRVDVTTETGVVTFENGDVIHVSSNGTYVGTLTYNGTQFAGEINEPTEGQKLQFYFLGNLTPEFNADNTECSVVISDQTEYLPVISYAPSRENYQVGKTDYNATLLNKCALVKFDVTSASEAATCILGMNNMVTVDFSTNEFTYGQEGEGIITLLAGTGYRWAILLPQDEKSDVEVVTEDNGYIGTIETMPAIAENDYLTDGVWVELEVNVPEGAINGLFSINTNGDKVYFSKGNLQYQASTNTWRFAESQWDWVGSQKPDDWGNTGGTVEGSDNQFMSSTYSGWIDLFGWGTSGYDHGAVCYQPWSTSQTYSDYYAYGDAEYSLYDQTGQADWGYNAISNGGNQENSGWRTLTYEEWNYLVYTRSTVSGIRWAKATVNDVNGTILLPDDWTESIYVLNNPNGGYYNYNNITAEDWVNVLEANGAVFLPAAGARFGNDSFVALVRDGYYWLASCGSATGVFSFYFYTGQLGTSSGNGHHSGISVRLVRNAE